MGDRKASLARLARWVLADPNSLAALEESARLLSESAGWEELALLYEATLPRVSEPAVAVELATKIDVLCRDVLKKPDRAVMSLERAAELSPDDTRIRRRLVELLSARGAPLGALPHLVVALRKEPRVSDFREAIRLFDRAGRPDAAWNAACALEVLGAADVNESLLASAHRPEGLLPAKSTLTDEHWKKRLLARDRDASIDELWAALDGAIVDVGLETARRKKRLLELDPSAAMDPEKSTATLIKMLSWSAKLLGIATPKVYLFEALSVPLFAPPAREPTLLVSKTLGSGLEMPALAFLWSRQLAFLRPEHRAIVFFPSAAELGALVLASLSLGGLPQLPRKKLEGDAKLFARGMSRTFPSEAPPELVALVRKFPVREATERIFAWARSVEHAAARAGLLACGNIELAAALTRKYPLGGLVEPEEQVTDLLGYSVSDEYAVLRDRLGVLVRSK
jgi:tetratricopeptide (TPR) repeat protein